MFRPEFLALLVAFVAGSHCFGAPDVAQNRTLPVGSMCACIALHGQVITGDHWPTVAGSCASADQTPIKPAPTNEKSPTSLLVPNGLFRREGWTLEDFVRRSARENVQTKLATHISTETGGASSKRK